MRFALRPLSLVLAASSLCRPGAAAAAAAAAAPASRGMMTSTHKIRQENGGYTLVLDPRKGAADSLVVVSHGLGDSAHGWVDTVAESIAPRLPSARFILPTAPTQPVTVNNGYAMPSWYDIESLGRDRDRSVERAKGIEKSQATLLKFVEEARAAGIPPERVILAGFSQGGALSLYTGLNFPARLGGIVVLSAYMPVPAQVKPPSPETLTTPILFCHGDEDDVVPLDAARDAEKRVKAFGVKDVEFHVIEGMPHGADPDEIALVSAWIKKRLEAAAAAPKPSSASAGVDAASGAASTSAAAAAAESGTGGV